jgi:hypothetical protein
LPETGACPECAKPIEESVRGVRRVFRSERHIAKLIRASTILAVIGVLRLAMLVYLWLVPGTMLMRHGSWLWLLLALAAQAGWWKFSTNAYSARPDPHLSASRVAARFSVLAGVLADCATIAFWRTATGSWGKYAWFGTSAVLSLQFCAVMVFAAILAVRIGGNRRDRSLAVTIACMTPVVAYGSFVMTGPLFYYLSTSLEIAMLLLVRRLLVAYLVRHQPREA